MKVLWSKLMTAVCVLFFVFALFSMFGPRGAIYQWVGTNPSTLSRLAKWTICVIVFWVGGMQILAFGFPRPQQPASPIAEPHTPDATRATVAAALTVLAFLLCMGFKAWVTG